MYWETKEILITVKGYPSPSKKYGETVCTAGVDLTTNNWIRLYPVPFRFLTFDKQFKKYSIIKANVRKAKNDARPESYNIDCGSIQFIDWISSADGWKKRKKFIEPLAAKSMCEIERLSKTENLSLGFFKPNRNVEFSSHPVSRKSKPGERMFYDQPDLFIPEKESLEKIPYIFRYHYYCENEFDCKGHHQCIVDWEIGEAYRSWQSDYKTKEKTVVAIERKWKDEMFAEKKDTYFFTGNHSQYKTFMILGVFWPPRE